MYGISSNLNSSKFAMSNPLSLPSLSSVIFADDLDVLVNVLIVLVDATAAEECPLHARQNCLRTAGASLFDICDIFTSSYSRARLLCYG